MKKIPTAFVRDHNNRSRVTTEITQGCEWVLGEGVVALRKYDGTCCARDIDGTWWKRRMVKPGKNEPEGFRQVDYDPRTGKMFGWVPVSADDRWHQEGIERVPHAPPGTYELIGPKVQGNPERVDRHVMVRHSMADLIPYEPKDRSYAGIARLLEEWNVEGFIFVLRYQGVYPGGYRMAKVKASDFGINRAHTVIG